MRSGADMEADQELVLAKKAIGRALGMDDAEIKNSKDPPDRRAVLAG